MSSRGVPAEGGPAEDGSGRRIPGRGRAEDGPGERVSGAPIEKWPEQQNL